MKDALGHGSDERGGAAPAKGQGVHGRYLIQKLNPKLAGNPWQTVKAVSPSSSFVRPQAKAERIAMRMAADTHRYNATQAMRVRAR